MDITENPPPGNGGVRISRLPSPAGGFHANDPVMDRTHRIAGVAILMIQALAAQTENFIRVHEDASAARLQTAITRYRKDAATVDLIGAIHIADKGYYAQLNTRFKAYDALLFEMVGGENIAAGAPHAAQPPPAEPEPVAPRKKERDLTGLRKFYDMVARSLNLTGQSDAIDYHAQNFVHADLTLREFNRLQNERHESLLGFFLKAANQASDTSKGPDSLNLIRALLFRNPNLLKLEIVHTLGQGDDQIAAFAGESVIISDRNQRCLEVMTRELAAGHKNLGIFYGAAHFPDMEKRLLKHGFKPVKQEWLTAWNIPKNKPKRL